MKNKESQRSKRFTSEKTAKDFAKTVKGDIKDLRNQPQSKSNFKVTYKKEDAHNGMKNRENNIILDNNTSCLTIECSDYGFDD